MRFHTLAYLLASAPDLPTALAKDPPGLVTIIKASDNKQKYGFKSFVERPSGNLLVSRNNIDLVPSVWDIDPNKKTGKQLFEIPGADGAQGMSAPPDEVYVFWAYKKGKRSDKKGIPGFWKVDLSEGDDKKPELVKDFPDGFSTFIQIAPWDDTRVVVCNLEQNKVHILDIGTGKLEVAIDTPKITYCQSITARKNWIYLVIPAPSVNGQGGGDGDLYRISVDGDARPQGELELVAAGHDLGYQMDVADDGTVYTVSFDKREVRRFKWDGSSDVIAGGPDEDRFWGLQSVKIGRTKGKTETLYISTGCAVAKGYESQERSIMAIPNFKAL